MDLYLQIKVIEFKHRFAFSFTTFLMTRHIVLEDILDRIQRAAGLTLGDCTGPVTSSLQNFPQIVY